MTSRERVMNAVAHKNGELPIDFGTVYSSIHYEGYKKLREYLKLKEEDPVIQDWFQMTVYVNDDIYKMFGSDTLPLYANPTDEWKMQIRSDNKGEYWSDEFGTEYYKPYDGYYFDLHEQPLFNYETLEDFKKFKFTDPENPGRIRGLKEKAKRMHEETNKAIIFTPYTPGAWELCFFLRGLENFLTDMVLNPKIAEYILDKVNEWQVAFYSYVLKEIGEYVDIVRIGDDLGTTNGLIFGKELYRKFVRPRERKVINAIKKTNRYVHQHSCGAISELIPDLIENGVDILGPVQVGATNMDSKYLKKEFGKDITFWGGGCDNDILTYGTPEEVIKETSKRIEDFRTDGGYVFACVHNMQRNMPPENITALYETALKQR